VIIRREEKSYPTCLDNQVRVLPASLFPLFSLFFFFPLNGASAAGSRAEGSDPIEAVKE